MVDAQPVNEPCFWNAPSVSLPLLCGASVYPLLSVWVPESVSSGGRPALQALVQVSPAFPLSLVFRGSPGGCCCPLNSWVDLQVKSPG